MNNSAVVDLDCNVNIKVIGREGKVVRNTDIHNKATVSLVDGILRFLKGDFTPVSYSKTHSSEEGVPYLPTKVSFGYVGVDTSNQKDCNPDPSNGIRYFKSVNESKFVQSVFSTQSLQDQCFSTITGVKDGSPITFSFNKVRQVGYSDSNNSECLEFITYVSPGNLVGEVIEEGSEDSTKRVFYPYTHSYYNPSTGEYEAMITEVGLISDTGVMLARVLLDGEVGYEDYITNEQNLGRYPVPKDPDGRNTPIIQTESSTVVITWRIGIVSVGKDDQFVTDTDLTVNNMSMQLSEREIEEYDIFDKDLIGYISTSVNNDGVIPDNIKSYIINIIDRELESHKTYHSDLTNSLIKDINDILKGSKVSDLKEESQS